MSRKRRYMDADRNLVTPNQVIIGKPTAAYIRLSNDSDSAKSEDSIKNQTTLVHQFIQSNPELQLMDTYVDCGFSGTKFDRPEFSRLLEDARNGRIECIVVKDLSRFGRNYIEAGYYIENLFQRLNIQLISITDNFDSTCAKDLNGLETPLKNIINDFYAKDMSRKNCLAAQIQRDSGKKVPRGSAPYGYQFSADKSCYIPNEKTAPYVRLIFQWTIQGVGLSEIVRRLTLLNAITPGQYRMETVGRTESKVEKKWTTSTIQNLLRQPVYQGKLVFGRVRAELYRGIPAHKTDASEWVVYENAHEPLVTPEDYQKARQVIANRARRNGFVKYKRDPAPHRYSGRIICQCCGRKMVYRSISDKSGADVGMYCCVNRCVPGICEDRIRTSIWEYLKKLVELAYDPKTFDETAIEKSVSALHSEQRKRETAIDRLISDTQAKIEMACGDYADGIISRDEYREILTAYTERIQTLRNERMELENDAVWKEKVKRYSDTLRLIRACCANPSKMEELEGKMIENIYICEDQKLEIQLGCEDVFQDFHKIFARRVL